MQPDTSSKPIMDVAAPQRSDGPATVAMHEPPASSDVPAAPAQAVPTPTPPKPARKKGQSVAAPITITVLVMAILSLLTALVYLKSKGTI